MGMIVERGRDWPTSPLSPETKTFTLSEKFNKGLRTDELVIKTFTLRQNLAEGLRTDEKGVNNANCCTMDKRKANNGWG